MADTKTFVAGAPVWIDLSSADPADSREYYSKLFGWKVEVNPDPQYGGYAMATAGGKDVAGIGPSQSPDAPTAWTVYIGSDDVDETARKATAAGGKVVAPPMEIGKQGRMAVFQDPSGAFLGVWEAGEMQGAQLREAPGAFAWAELNARGIENATSFYEQVFGWSAKKSALSAEGDPPYIEFANGGQSISGGMEMNPMVPAEVPSYWMVYFGADDVDKTYQKALAAGGTEMLAPADFPGGRFAIVQDPQGAMFGILKTKPQG